MRRPFGSVRAAIAASAMLFACLVLPGTALARDGGSDGSGGGRDGESCFVVKGSTTQVDCSSRFVPSNYTGWARVNPSQCDAGGSCVHYSAAWAFSWSGKGWSNWSRPTGEQVWVAPFSGEWVWTWTSQWGWAAMQRHDVWL